MLSTTIGKQYVVYTAPLNTIRGGAEALSRLIEQYRVLYGLDTARFTLRSSAGFHSVDAVHFPDDTEFTIWIPLEGKRRERFCKVYKD